MTFFFCSSSTSSFVRPSGASFVAPSYRRNRTRTSSPSLRPKSNRLHPPSCPPLTHSPRAVARLHSTFQVARELAAPSLPAVPAAAQSVASSAPPLLCPRPSLPLPSPSASATTPSPSRRCSSRSHRLRPAAQRSPSPPLADRALTQRRHSPPSRPRPIDFGPWIGTKGFSNRVRAAAPSQLEIHLRRRDDAVRRPRRLQRRRSAAAKEGTVPPPPLEVGAADPRPLSGPAAAPGMLKVGTPRSRRPRPPDGSPAARSRHPPCSSHSTMPLPDLRFKVYDFNPTVSSKSWL